MRRSTLFVAACLALTIACDADPTGPLPKRSNPPKGSNPPRELHHFVLHHNTAVIRVYDAIAITVAAYDRDNVLLPAPTLEWRSEDPSIATVGPYGLVTGHGVGDVRIWASIDRLEAFTTISVRPALLQIALQSGSSVLQLGQTSILEAKFAGNAVPAGVQFIWESDGDEIDLRPLDGSGSRVEATSLKIGLSRISARARESEASFVFAVASAPEPEPPFEFTDFHYNMSWSDADHFLVIPSLRLAVAPSRTIKLIRLEIGIGGLLLMPPPLCSMAQLPPGEHDALGLNSYPASAGLLATWSDEEWTMLALLTYRSDDGVVRTAAVEGWVDPWGYDWVTGKIDWHACDSQARAPALSGIAAGPAEVTRR